ncbi:MAG: hypothetical protein M5U28_13315 [Sandaracinaceae bacterium]|nr:hypothetical protein [Sandaracinaceae bacterium]
MYGAAEGARGGCHPGGGVACAIGAATDTSAAAGGAVAGTGMTDAAGGAVAGMAGRAWGAAAVAVGCRAGARRAEMAVGSAAARARAARVASSRWLDGAALGTAPSRVKGSSASIIARAVWKRAAGSFCIARCATATRPGGSAELSVERWGGSRSWMSIRSCAPVLVKGGRPESIP